MKNSAVALLVALTACSFARAHMMGGSGRPASYGKGSSADAWQDLDPQEGNDPTKPKPKRKPKKSGPRTKLDKERAEEAERLKKQRAVCDAAPEYERDGCYGKMKADHEKWHEQHDPEEGDVKHMEKRDLRGDMDARAACNAIKDFNERFGCLKNLSQPRGLSEPLGQ